MSQLFRNTTVPLRPGRVLARRAGAGQRPMRMLKTKIRPIATGVRRAGRPATAVLTYLAPHGCGPGTLGPGERQAQYKEEP
jgi:hypothetical protein